MRAPSSRTRSGLFKTGPGAVLIGGLVGSSLRVAASGLVHRPDGGFPVATLIVNLVGAFAIGLFLGRRERSVTGKGSVDLWAIGLLGSLTTFSAFAVETVELIRFGDGVAALAYVLASLVGGFGLAFLGDRLGAVAR